ncbi:MAG: hypothetical protein QHJ73_08880, partial [Armatimonadota bacterium]|nr:hypothetical protein [Armatimonadota bacterium]
MNLFCFSLILAAAAGTAAAAPAPLVETDFGTAATPAVGRGGGENPNIRGVLPEGWFDDSGWAPTQVVYQRLEEEGRPFLRVRVLKADQGRCQLMHPLPRVEGETFYRLSLTARSASRIPLQTGVRDSGPPYRFAWEARPALTASWNEFAYDFRLDRYEPEVGLWLVLEGTGELDLARVRLTRLTREEYIAQLKARYPDGGPKNLLRVSRFPLGLQSGWSLSRDNSDGDDVVIGPDPTTMGPSGVPALKVQTNEPTTLYSAPFGVALAAETHTASLYARGDGELRLSVMGDGRQLAQKSFPLKPGEWQRLQLSFQPMLMGRGHGLRLDARATFWIDALQVAPGTEAGLYVSQLPCEVSLAIPPSDASPALVQFADEPALVRWAVSGPAAGALLKAKLVNAYGDEVDLPPVSLGTAALNQGEWRCDRFPQRPFGPLRLEAWVEDRQGRARSAPNELVFYRLPRPRYWGKDAPNSPFGVHTQSTTRHNLMAKAVGANWTRLHDAGLQYLGWYHLERRPGEWTFYDKEIHRYRRDHIKILGELGTAPEWASYFD